MELRPIWFTDKEVASTQFRTTRAALATPASTWGQKYPKIQTVSSPESHRESCWLLQTSHMPMKEQDKLHARCLSFCLSLLTSPSITLSPSPRISSNCVYHPEPSMTQVKQSNTLLSKQIEHLCDRSKVSKETQIQ